jgi:hypothetical protein
MGWRGMSAKTMQLKGFDYAKRLVRSLGIWEMNGWNLKVYGISATRDLWHQTTVATTVVESARQVAETVFTPSRRMESYGLGFVIVHEGLLANWLFLDWWADEIQVRHQIFRSDLRNPTGFARVTNDLVARIWELPVIAFEREAWVETMLKSPYRPDVRKYLDLQLPDTML